MFGQFLSSTVVFALLSVLLHDVNAVTVAAHLTSWHGCRSVREDDGGSGLFETRVRLQHLHRCSGSGGGGERGNDSV